MCLNVQGPEVQLGPLLSQKRTANTSISFLQGIHDLCKTSKAKIPGHSVLHQSLAVRRWELQKEDIKLYKTIVLQTHNFTVIATNILIKNTGNSCQLPAMSAGRHQQQLEPVSISQAVFGYPVPHRLSMEHENVPAYLAFRHCYSCVFPQKHLKGASVILHQTKAKHQKPQNC